MKSNKIYHIRLEREIIKTNYKENDFSHPIYTELATIIELEEAKYMDF